MERRRRNLYGFVWIGMENREIFLFSILLQVAWLRVDTQTILTIASHVITKNHRIAVSHSDHRTWFLHIREVKESDRGWYMCQINTDPMKSQTGYLEVVGKRSFDLIEYLIFSNRNWLERTRSDEKWKIDFINSNKFLSLLLRVCFLLRGREYILELSNFVYRSLLLSYLLPIHYFLLFHKTFIQTNMEMHAREQQEELIKRVY